MSGSRLPLRTRGIAAVVLFGVLAASCTDSLTETQESNSRAAAVTSADEYYYYRGARIPLTAESDRLVVAMTDGAQVTDVNAALAADGYSVRTAIPMWQAPGHSIVALSSQRNPGLARAVEVLRAHPRVRFAAPVYRTPEGDEMQLLDVALVAPKPGVSIQDLHPVAAAAGTRILDAPMPDSGRTFYRFKYLPTIDPLAALARLNTDPLIDWAAPNMVSNRELASPPGDPYYSLQYYLKNPRMRNGVNVDIAAEQAWQITTGDPGLQIAVVDDGVEIDFTSGLDFTMSGVGYFDAVCPPSGCGGDSPVNPFGDDSHGTMVSGLILGEHNATGIAGIAPGIKRLYVVRIFYNGIAVDDQMIAIGLQMARYAGSAVINNSWGGGAPSDAITAAIDSATIRGRGGLGTVVVFSAGNSSRREHGIYGPVRYPGKCRT